MLQQVTFISFIYAFAIRRRFTTRYTLKNSFLLNLLQMCEKFKVVVARGAWRTRRPGGIKWNETKQKLCTTVLFILPAYAYLNTYFCNL